jgi:hypothetical protein
MAAQPAQFAMISENGRMADERHIFPLIEHALSAPSTFGPELLLEAVA